MQGVVRLFEGLAWLHEAGWCLCVLHGTIKIYGRGVSGLLVVIDYINVGVAAAKGCGPKLLLCEQNGLFTCACLHAPSKELT